LPQNPGWYNDPWSRFESRWFDGTAWTDLVEEAPGLPGVDPPGPISQPVNAVVGPVAGATTVTTWEKFRKLPVAGQVAIWCTAGFILLLIAAGIVTLLQDDSTDKVTSESLPSELTTTTFFETTTTMLPTTVLNVPPPVVIVTDPTTTLPDTTVPVETSSSVESTTAVETTVEPTTSAAPTTTDAPTTTPPTTAPPTTTTVAVTTTTVAPTSTTAAPTTTTIPFDPNNSVCKDAKNDGAGNFDLLDSTIHRPDTHDNYVFTANAVGPPITGRDEQFVFALGDDDYEVVGEIHTDGTDEATVLDVATNISTPIMTSTISPGKVTLTVPNAQIAGVSGTSFDWTITLFVDGAEIDSCTVNGFGTTQ
jgi:hypothetical protein